MSILPPSRPGAPAERVIQIIRNGWISPTPLYFPTYCLNVPHIPPQFQLAILNVRGYYRDTMGKKGVNDAGVYDDAAFVITPDGVTSFNANTDPSVIGWNSALDKPYAILDQGVHVFVKGKHKGKYAALRQPDDEQAAALDIPNHGYFPVIRDDGKGNRYKDVGYHAINMHKGSVNGTSSWGCQTIPPSQYDEWQQLVYAWSVKLRQQKIPVMLINGTIN